MGRARKREKPRGRERTPPQHLPFARLDKNVTIATTRHAPRRWQVQTLYLQYVEVARAEERTLVSI